MRRPSNLGDLGDGNLLLDGLFAGGRDLVDAGNGNAALVAAHPLVLALQALAPLLGHHLEAVMDTVARNTAGSHTAPVALRLLPAGGAVGDDANASGHELVLLFRSELQATRRWAEGRRAMRERACLARVATCLILVRPLVRETCGLRTVFFRRLRSG